MKHYEGELGIFDYDETQFKIFMGAKICYIGNETDGSKIVIPDGIIDLSDTFRGSKLVTPPFIPDSVVYCNCTFYSSYFLTQAAELPEGILDTSNMYHGCKSLVNAGSIPSTVVNCDEMFSGCSALEEGAIFDPVPECSRWLMYYCCISLKKVYDIECTEQTEYMYTSCFNLSLSDEQVAKLSSVNPLALGKTFVNCTGLLKHYFIPILLSDALDRITPYSLKRFNLTKQEAIEKWIMPFVQYEVLPDYSVEDLMSMSVMGIPDDLKSQYVEDVFQQQFDSYKNHNSANAETSSSSRTSENSTYAKGVNAFL